MSEQYVTLAEVKELLTERYEKKKATIDAQTVEVETEVEPEEDGSFQVKEPEVILQVQKAAMLHAQAVTREINKEKAQAIVDEVSKLDFVTDAIAYKIADILPKYPEDVRAIFTKERIALEADDINKIIDIVNEKRL